MPTPIKLKQGTNYYQPLCYFPIGYIYLSTSNVNPGQFFGGTWEPIKDRFLLLAGDTYTGGQTGGEATHKLTIDEMPSHYHGTYNNGFSFATMKSISGSSGKLRVGMDGRYGFASNNGYDDLSVNNGTGRAGGNQPHNNMPPYIVVYGWVKVSN